MTPPKAKNIFSGVKLSEQTSVAQPGVEQRLFGSGRPEPPADPPAAAPTPPAATNAPPRSAPPLRPTASSSPKPSAEPPASTERSAIIAPDLPDGAAGPASPARFAFDVSATPHRKDSFLFTTEEFEALEDLKLEVGRALGEKVTKQNLVRCAVAHLVDDWRRKGIQSAVIAPLKRRSR